MKNTGAKIRAGAEVIDFANNEDAFQRAAIMVLERYTLQLHLQSTSETLRALRLCRKYVVRCLSRRLMSLKPGVNLG